MNKNYKYEIVESRFHGGGHIAYATSLRTAAKRLWKGCGCCKGSGCRCGGPYVLTMDGYNISEEEEEKLFDFMDLLHEGKEI